MSLSKNQKRQCITKPYFVMVKSTNSGYSFDNHVNYTSPFAEHKLIQKSNMLHPSLIVNSDWKLNKNKSISRLITGESARNFREKKPPNEIRVEGARGGLNGMGYANIIKRDGTWTIARHNSIGNSGSAASVAEVAMVLNGLSKKLGNIKIRGSPLEYKRMLDYLQFIMVKKVSGNDSISLARPNNAYIMQEMRDTSSTIENAYMKVFNNPDKSNRTIYKNAYFVSYDRLAAFASVIRDIPTVYQKQQKYYVMDKGKYIQKIIQEIEKDLKTTEHISFERKVDSKGRTHILSYKKRPVITSSKLFGWFLDTRDVFKNDGEVKGSGFHKIDKETKVKILFYWVFNYPHLSGRPGVPNPIIIEYFLSLVDTFHDFSDDRAKSVFRGIWPTSDSYLWSNSRRKLSNGITNSNIPKTEIQHRFLVDLLGIDIYRRAERKVYDYEAVESIKKTNTRTQIDPHMRLAHFLYFIVNILGSQSARGNVVGECEEYASKLMLKISEKNTPENIEKKMSEKNACLVVDAISGSLPSPMKKISVYHNIGILDQASSHVLTWGDLNSPPNCPKSIAKEKTAEQKKRVKEEVSKLGLNFTRMSKANRKIFTAKLNRADKRRDKKEAENIEEKRKKNAKQNKLEKAKKDRNARLAARGGVLIPQMNRTSKRKRNNNNNNKSTPKKLQTVNRKGNLNNRVNNNKLTPRKSQTANRTENMKMNINNRVNKKSQTVNKTGNVKMNINPHEELNKLTSLRQNQKNIYLKKIKQDPNNILRILNNAKRVASTQRVINNALLELNKLISLRQNQKNYYLEKMKQNPSSILAILNKAKQVANKQRTTRSRTPGRTPK